MLPATLTMLITTTKLNRKFTNPSQVFLKFFLPQKF